jgi:hypothetical protein
VNASNGSLAADASFPLVPQTRFLFPYLFSVQAYLDILSTTTGHPIDKLDRDMQRPLYMQPQDALDYGIIDGEFPPLLLSKPERVGKERGRCDCECG